MTLKALNNLSLLDGLKKISFVFYMPAQIQPGFNKNLASGVS